MVVGCSVTVGSGFLSKRGPCAVDASNVRLGFTMYLSYFVLFAILFYNLYLKKGGKHARSAKGRDDADATETLCGVDLRKGDASGFFHGAANGGAAAPKKKATVKKNGAAAAPASPKRATRSASGKREKAA